MLPTIKEKFLKDFAKIIEIDKVEVRLDKPLQQYANYDSLALVSTIALVKQHFNVDIAWERIEECKTLNDLFNKINSKI